MLLAIQSLFDLDCSPVSYLAHNRLVQLGISWLPNSELAAPTAVILKLIF